MPNRNNVGRWNLLIRSGIIVVVMGLACRSLRLLSITTSELLEKKHLTQRPQDETSAPRQEYRGEKTMPSSPDNDVLPKLGKLVCEKYGGPSEAASQEMVYWRDFPEDREYKSPFRSSKNEKKRKYVSVVMDAGGFNNIRMQVEIAMAFAHATGRTFIIPPRQGIYLLEDTYSLHDFYNLDGLDVIEMEDFLKQEVMSASIRDKKGHRVFPPGNRTDWTSNAPREDIFEEDQADSRQLDYFMRTLGKSPKFLPRDKLIFVPKRPTTGHQITKWVKFAQELEDEQDNTKSIERRTGSKWLNSPTPVNASTKKRLEEVIQDRKLWPYDEALHRARLIYFMADDEKWIRLMTLFYYALFFEDWKMDLVVKRYVRDRLRYRDELFCAAARIVERMRERSRKHGNGGRFYTYHVRRNDFAHIDLFESAEALLVDTEDVVPRNATVYIATDEKDKSWFDPLRKRFHVYFLDNFLHDIKDLSSSYYGILDEIVATRGEVFVGAYSSTFTSHIIHMRGYYSQVEKKPGWEMGILNSSYFATKEFKYIFQRYRSFGFDDVMDSGAYPIAWRDIDKGIGLL